MNNEAFKKFESEKAHLLQEIKQSVKDLENRYEGVLCWLCDVNSEIKICSSINVDTFNIKTNDTTTTGTNL